MLVSLLAPLHCMLYCMLQLHVLHCCCIMQQGFEMLSVLHNATVNTTDKFFESRESRKTGLRGCCMTIQLVYKPALVVLLYCIAISLEMQYNTIYNASNTIVQYATTQAEPSDLTNTKLP